MLTRLYQIVQHTVIHWLKVINLVGVIIAIILGIFKNRISEVFSDEMT